MNLIDRIAKLRELEAKADAGPWIYGIYPDNCDLCEDCEYDPHTHKDLDCANPIKQSWQPIAMIGDGYCVPGIYAPTSSLDFGNENGKLIEELRNAARDLLSALDFQPGDAVTLDKIIAIFDAHETAMNGSKNAHKYDDEIKVLRRYQAMAVKMTEESK